jgi:hypothetical protein
VLVWCGVVWCGAWSYVRCSNQKAAQNKLGVVYFMLLNQAMSGVFGVLQVLCVVCDGVWFGVTCSDCVALRCVALRCVARRRSPLN